MAAEEATTVVPEDESEMDLAISDVCTKYREAAKIANLALQGVITQVPHAPTARKGL